MTMAVTLYGIPNCDTVKKARTWLAEHGVEHQFHDFKKAGITPDMIAAWLQQVGWETLVNRKGTTWRGLDDARKAQIGDAASATALMLETPSVIKRPVLVTANTTQVGFTPDLYQQIFKK
ncbi:ArsC family reductase [Oxalobacteraceae bacterium OM1]|nr:ArsC family reductase [Oxalobacteraceae bacterium OM1]